MSERQGVEIDYCPECRGVWLDRGELDKIIERSDLQGAAPLATQPVNAPQQPAYGHGPAPSYGHGQNHGHGHGHKPYKKKSFLEELFD